MEKFWKRTILVFFVASIFALSYASSQGNFIGPTQRSDFVTSLGEFLADVFGSLRVPAELILGSSESGDILLAKSMFFILILVVLFKVIDKVPLISDNDAVRWVVSIGVAILSTRWLTNFEIVYTAILPYSTLGIAISAGLPFLIYFFIVNELPKTIRKIGWVLFSVLFFALWIYRRSEVGIGAWAYLITALLSIAVLTFDGTIQRIRGKIKAEKSMTYINTVNLDRIEKEIESANNLLTSELSKPSPDQRRIRSLREKLKNLEKAHKELISKL